MKKRIFSVVMFLIGIMIIRVMYNVIVPPTPPLSCVTTVSPRCPIEQQTVTVTAELFEDGIILQISAYPYTFILPYYGATGYGYLSTYPDNWGGSSPGRNLDTYRAELGEVTQPAITYTTTLEVAAGTLSPHDDTTYIRLSDGRGIGFDVLSGHWFFVE